MIAVNTVQVNDCLHGMHQLVTMLCNLESSNVHMSAVQIRDGNMTSVRFKRSLVVHANMPGRGEGVAPDASREFIIGNPIL